MPDCNICGERIPDGSRTCSVCGSSVDEFAAPPTTMADAPAAKTELLPSALPPGVRRCLACATVFGPDYTDAFCTCGTELLEPLPMAPVMEDLPMAPYMEDAPIASILDDPTPVPTTDVDDPSVKVRSVKPQSGTPCLVLYGPDKQPLQYFPLEKDAMSIGRLDAVAGNFPDVDLDEWFERAIIRKISRQHALILRTRATNTFVLRPLTGNTGTQLEAQMLTPQQDYPLKHGHRIILGGVIRLKFEIA